MKILVISRVAWNKSNSFGNTYDNLLGGNKEFEIANIYCAGGQPNSTIVKRFFCINERMILKKVCRITSSCGKEVVSDSEIDDSQISKLKIEKDLKKKWQILYWMRDLIWETNVWKSRELKQFLDDFKPDLIFSPLYYSIYMNKIRCYIKTYTHVPMISFVSDDVYTLKQWNLSPLFWINRFLIRSLIRKTIAESKKLYVISKEQKEEYDKAFKINTSVLFKGGFFYNKDMKKCGKIIKMVYIGNLSVGRWKTIVEIGKAIKRINITEEKIFFDVYSLTPLESNILNRFRNNSINFKGGLSGEKVSQVLDRYDILVHCESFSVKEKLQVRLSFSTKIVDYFVRHRCIFAVGPRGIASIEYLLRNDAAIIASTYDEIENQIKRIVENKELIELYAEKGWKCGQKNHDLNIIRKKLYLDFIDAVGDEK